MASIFHKLIVLLQATFFLDVFGWFQVLSLVPENMCESNYAVAHPELCSHFYLSWEDGERYLFMCPEGLHFNQRTSSCDWPQKSDCKATQNLQVNEKQVKEEVEVCEETDENHQEKRNNFELGKGDDLVTIDRVKSHQESMKPDLSVVEDETKLKHFKEHLNKAMFPKYPDFNGDGNLKGVLKDLKPTKYDHFLSKRGVEYLDDKSVEDVATHSMVEESATESIRMEDMKEEVMNFTRITITFEDLERIFQAMYSLVASKAGYGENYDSRVPIGDNGTSRISEEVIPSAEQEFKHSEEKIEEIEEGKEKDKQLSMKDSIILPEFKNKAD